MVGAGGAPGNGFIFRTRTTRDAKLLQAENELNNSLRSAPMSRRARLAGASVLGGLMVAGIVAKLLAGL